MHILALNLWMLVVGYVAVVLVPFVANVGAVAAAALLWLYFFYCCLRLTFCFQSTAIVI